MRAGSSTADVAAIAPATGLRAGSSKAGEGLKNCGDPDTEPTRWALWRLDDNDNRFVVAVFARREEAEAAARAFEAHGHKQTYWVEAADGAAPRRAQT